MWRLLFVFTLLLPSCAETENKSSHIRRPGGYYYRLLSFENESRQKKNAAFAWVHITCSTQNDSVFWDSWNNLNDRCYYAVNDTSAANYLLQEINKAAEGDSLQLLIPVRQFFLQNFGFAAVPPFAGYDSVIKVNLKVKDLLGSREFDAISHNLAARELWLVKEYLKNCPLADTVADAGGFYWLEKDQINEGVLLKAGEQVKISYKGYFLNNRLCDNGADTLTVTTGEPGQLIKGLNNVMLRLKPGENAKIIIPSPLAFGDCGSSTGLVPAYTPLIYEIKVHSQ